MSQHQINVNTTEQDLLIVVIGTARDAHERFPIRFDYAESGKAFFNGCRVESVKALNNGSSITKRMDVRAFGEIAEQLAHVQDGTEVALLCEYGQQKNEKDGKWYPIATVLEVINA